MMSYPKVGFPTNFRGQLIISLMFQKPDNIGNIGGGFSFVFVSCSPLLSEKLPFDEHIFSTGLKPPTFR